MKIGILGAICHDEIVTYDGQVRESFGGISYNVAAFCTLLGPDDVVRPCSKLGEDRYEEVLTAFSGYENLDRRGLVRLPGVRLTDVRLTYESATHRDECVQFLMPALTIDDLEPVLDCDAILVNFIVGVEIGLETLYALRERFGGLLAMDIHNLVFSFNEAGKRSECAVPNWREWLQPLDYVQMNETECALLLGESVEDAVPAYQEAAKVIATALRPKPEGHDTAAAVVTLADRGSVVAYYKDGEIRAAACPARPIREVVEPTGCGDSFSAGYMANFLRCSDPVLANAAANIVAGANCQYAGLASLAEGRDALEHVHDYYPLLGGR